MNAGMIVTFSLLLLPVLYAQETGVLPLEFRKIPINGNDLVGDPEAVTVNYGFTTRTGSKIVEHGDSVTLLDSYEGLPTPHTKWVVPYARGPVRVLFVTSQAYGGRNPLELRQRSNFQISILHIPGVLNDARPDRQPVVHDFFWTKFQKLLDAECDVVFLATGDLEGGYRDFDNVKDRILRRIKEKVAAGCGLVLLHGNPRWYRLSKSRLAWLDELSPLKHGHSGITDRPARTQVRSAVSDSFSFASWPHATTNQVTADAGADVLATLGGRPFIATGRHGKGRVAAAYFQVQRINSGILPLFDPEKVTQLGDTHEPVYAFYLKALAWAAGREPLAELSVPELTRSKAGESPKVVVRADLSAKALEKGGFALRYELRDPWGNRIRQVPNSVEISPPGGQVTIPLVRLHANGLYRIDLWLLRDGKIENWGYTAIQVEGGATLHVERKIGSPAKSRFRILTDTAGILRVIATDDMDRVFHESSHSVSRTGDHEIVVDLSRSCLPRNRVSFTLFNGKESIVLARKVHDLYIPRIGLGSMKGEYMLASYGSTTCEPHLARYLGALYREAGLNTIYLNWHHRTYIRDNAANLGLFNITGSSWVMRQFDLNKDLKLSPNKPEVRAGFQQKIIQAVNDVQTYGGVGRVLDDETWFAYTKYERGEMRGAQADQSEPSLELFREAMQKKYQAIARLNEAWGTSFQSFETMKPIEENMIRGLAPPPYTWDETKDGKPVFVVEDNPSGWLEFRQYMNWTFANRYYAWVTEQHQKDLGEDYAAGCGAPHWATKGNPTYRGGDMAELKKVMKFMMLYGGSSEAYPDAFVGQPGAQKYDPPLNWQQFGSWYHLFTGADALWFYYGHAMIGSEIAWRQHAVWLKQATEDIRSGAGALIRDAQPLNRQVRVLYSGENLAMQWLFAKRKDTWKALAKDRTQSTLNKVLSDDFIRGSPVTAVDIRKGDLKDCRLLILPLAFCMDDATAAAIREYVRGGGCVVADLLPGIRNRFGKVRARGALSEIFGVKQGDSTLHQESEVWFSVGVGYADKLEKDGVNDGPLTFASELTWLPGDVWHIGLEHTTAKPEATLLSKAGKESYGCYMNDFGKGKAMLLNFVYCNYDFENAGWHRAFSRELVKWAGLVSPARILKRTNAPLPYPLFSFSRGEALLLASIRGRLQWVGQRPQLLDETRAANFDDQVKFAWTGKRHAYNVRDRKYLGEVTEAQVDLPSFHGRLLTLLPYKVEALRIDAPSKAPAGKKLHLSAKIITDGNQPGEHVFRMEVFSPTGYRNLIYCRTKTAASGEASCQIPFANNDRRGQWTVLVRDVMTGVESKKIVELE